MMKQKLFGVVRRSKSERGLSLLEYAAGATVLITIVYFGMTALGDNIVGYLDAIGAWTTNEAADINRAIEDQNAER